MHRQSRASLLETSQGFGNGIKVGGTSPSYRRLITRQVNNARMHVRHGKKRSNRESANPRQDRQENKNNAPRSSFLYKKILR